MNEWINHMNPAQAQAHFAGRAADLWARWMLTGLMEKVYQGPGNTGANEAVTILWHACYYLEDRIGYEINPAPAGMILLEDVTP